MNLCYCNSEKLFKDCCEPYLKGLKKTPTAEALMRSRYSAYASHQADYLVATTHISQRSNHSREDILLWAISNKWQKLEILKATETTVEFKAYFLDQNKTSQIHHEFSTFKQEEGDWYYVDGQYF
ncbi:MAG TPA: YchJ family metal-binding protein [Flavobacterium sp.]|nr:YchJ family metal-binding protein [Flavobacterium sp.]